MLDARRERRVASALRDLTELDYGAERYLRDGITISDEEFRVARQRTSTRSCWERSAIPRVPGNEHAKDILLGMRFQARPLRQLPAVRRCSPRS